MAKIKTQVFEVLGVRCCWAYYLTKFGKISYQDHPPQVTMDSQIRSYLDPSCWNLPRHCVLGNFPLVRLAAIHDITNA